VSGSVVDEHPFTQAVRYGSAGFEWAAGNDEVVVDEVRIEQ
jgi:hypothetical protein